MGIADILELIIKDFIALTEEKVLNSTISLYENGGVVATNISSNVETINNPIHGKWSPLKNRQKLSGRSS